MGRERKPEKLEQMDRKQDQYRGDGSRFTTSGVGCGSETRNSKAIKGGYWTCRQFGHKASQCPNKGKTDGGKKKDSYYQKAPSKPRQGIATTPHDD